MQVKQGVRPLHGSGVWAWTHTPSLAPSSLQTSATRSQTSTGSVSVPSGFRPFDDEQPARSSSANAIRFIGSTCDHRWIAVKRGGIGPDLPAFFPRGWRTLAAMEDGSAPAPGSSRKEREPGCGAAAERRLTRGLAP